MVFAISSGTNLPDLSSKPNSTRTAQASTSPEPQIPMAGVSSMVPITNSPSFTLTVSMAPAAARTPHLIDAASNAGPAGAAVARIRSPSPRMISQLVPTSINNRSRLSRSIPEARAPAIMSPPT